MSATPERERTIVAHIFCEALKFLVELRWLDVTQKGLLQGRVGPHWLHPLTRLLHYSWRGSTVDFSCMYVNVVHIP